MATKHQSDCLNRTWMIILKTGGSSLHSDNHLCVNITSSTPPLFIMWRQKFSSFRTSSLCQLCVQQMKTALLLMSFGRPWIPGLWQSMTILFGKDCPLMHVPSSTSLILLSPALLQASHIHHKLKHIFGCFFL